MIEIGYLVIHWHDKLHNVYDGSSTPQGPDKQFDHLIR